MGKCGGAQFCHAILWIIIFCTVAWFLAGIGAYFYIIFMCFQACCDVSACTDFLLKLAKVPYFCCRGVFKCRPVTDWSD